MKKLTLVLGSLLLIGIASVEASSQTRIRFARGSTSASVSSSIGGRGDRSFVLTAGNGQTLSANVSSRGGCVTFDNDMTSKNYETGRGNNYIAVFNRCRTAVRFTLTVSIY